jgi:hypothetical protein
MIVLSWIVLVMCFLLGLLEFLNMLANQNGVRRFLSFMFVAFYIITAITAFADIFA